VDSMPRGEVEEEDNDDGLYLSPMINSLEVVVRIKTCRSYYFLCRSWIDSSE
jgi:hypothetical protein